MVAADSSWSLERVSAEAMMIVGAIDRAEAAMDALGPATEFIATEAWVKSAARVHAKV